jgi:hypothetical protein
MLPGQLPQWLDYARKTLRLPRCLRRGGMRAKNAQAAPLLAAGGNEGVWQGARCPLPNGG